MRLKQRPEDFSVKEAYRFDATADGRYRVYLMDKQKVSTFEAVERICRRYRLHPGAVSYCGLKDKQGRTEQIIAIDGRDIEFQEDDLRLKPLGRCAEPLSSANLTANRFAVTVRGLRENELARIPQAVAALQRTGLINYFDSQRFGGVKHGQGFIAKDLVKGNAEHALYNYMAHPSTMDKTDDAKVKQFWKDNWGDWRKRCPWPAVAKYRRILVHLQEHPGDWVGAFLKIESRPRAMILFEYQSYLWNEGVKEVIRSLFHEDACLSLGYQAGRLLFPVEGPRSAFEELRKMSFPLLSAGSPLPNPRIRAAVERVFQRERLTQLQLTLPKGLFFKHEERPIVVEPGKLVVGKPADDEMNRGFAKVNVAFTLPPGAYATLVTRRLFWFSALEDEADKSGELHPRAKKAIEGSFGPGAARGPNAELKPPAPPPAPKLGFREKAAIKKAKRAADRAQAPVKKEKVTPRKK